MPPAAGGAMTKHDLHTWEQIPPPGPECKGAGRTRFALWAPRAKTVDLHLFSPEERVVSLSPSQAAEGYFQSVLNGVAPGARYKYRLDGKDEFPDPASRFQPEGVHGPSELVDDRFDWRDASWAGLSLSQYLIYELHVGAFTREGTFDSAISQLGYLRDLGVTALEIMPVAQFPGGRNWGYDGVYPYAVQNTYGGPLGFKRFIDAAHGHGFAVVLDVVYNHLGPEGNYLSRFGPYFTDRYHTPWGDAVNFDGPDSMGVRRYFISNAIRWITEFHVDAIRLDAVHAIFDHSSRHILADLADAVRRRASALGRRVHVFAESDMNDCRLVQKREDGGYGLDSQWSDDFHHSLHTVLTGEKSGYYADFGELRDLGKALASGFVYTGQFSKYRDRCHGSDSSSLPGYRFVVCSENHDQIGNRMLGDRLATHLTLAELKLAAGIVLLSPFIPLIFMGQEYGEPAPFLYFVSHSDPGLIEAVRNGRRNEFANFEWNGEVPDPQDERTFHRSRLNFAIRDRQPHAALLDFYRTAIRLRKSHPSLGGAAELNKSGVLPRNSSAQSWGQLAPQLKDYVGLSESLDGFLIFLVAFFSSLGVLNTMMMAVFERTHEIGMLGALGTRPIVIVTSIVLESLSLASLGLTAGFGLGTLLMLYLTRRGLDLSHWIGELSILGARMDPVLKGSWAWNQVLWSALALGAASLIAALIPARKAAWMKPVEALQAPTAV
jgi:maltooligosyltrehalose trehalohydrolase